MKIKGKFRNLLAWGNKPVEIDLTQGGITSIRGKNVTSKSKSTNGVGKSTILNSIIYMLYGNYPEDYKKLDMINDSVSKNCLGELWVEKNGHNAYIVRGIKCDEMQFNNIEISGDFLLFFLDGKDLRGHTTKDTQESITDFLSIDYDSFVTAALFTTSKEPFAGKTSSKQDEILSKLLHLEKLEVARKKVSNRIKEVKEDIRNCDNEVAKLESHVSREKVRLDEVDNAKEEWKIENRAVLESLENKKTRIMLRIKECEDNATQIDKEVEDAKEVLEDLQEDLSGYDLDNLKIIKQRANDDLSKVDTSIGEAKYQIRASNSEIKQAQSMQGETVCSKCFSVVDEDNLYKVIEEKNVELKNAEDKLENLTEKRLEAHRCLKEAESSISEVNSLQNSVISQSSLLSRLYGRQTSNTKEIDNETKNLTDLEIRIKDIANKKPPQSVDSKGIKLEIEKLEDMIIAEGSNKAKFQLDLEDLDFWLKGFGSSGIRNLLVRSVIPELNKHANRFADILTNGEVTIQFTGETEVGSGNRTQSRNKLVVNVLDKTGSNKYYKESGGEKQRVNICVSLAINFLVASRGGLPFIMMDEIFLSMDNRGKEMTMELLYSLKKDIPSIFVISNTEDILNESFDNIWTVIRENKTSRIEIE